MFLHKGEFFLKKDYKLEEKLYFNSSLLRAREPIRLQSILAGFYNNSKIYKTNLMFYSVWCKMSERAHKVIRVTY